MVKTHLIERIFVRQNAAYDCGKACLMMIVNYKGSHKAFMQLRSLVTNSKGHSLADLKRIGLDIGLKPRAVQMDIETLASLDSPCILHVLNEFQENHYVVCYGTQKKNRSLKFAIADPASYIRFLSQEELVGIWQTHAALFFEDLAEDRPKPSPSWFRLWQLKNFPAPLLVAVPLLTLFGAISGIAVSWLLQKGISDVGFLHGRTAVCLLTLLLIICIGRNVINYLKQNILIKLNIALNDHLMRSYLSSTFDENNTSLHDETFNLKQCLLDIQKIQNAISSFIATLCSEGMLVLVMLISIFFYIPLVGFMTTISFILQNYLIQRLNVPSKYHLSEIRQVAAKAETMLLEDFESISLLMEKKLLMQRKGFHVQNHLRLLEKSELEAKRSSQMTLLLEVIGAINLLIALIIGLAILQNGGISYTEFMIVIILNYLSNAFVPKLANAISVISEGAAAAIQFCYTLGISA